MKVVHHELRMPDLGLGGQPVTASVWLVEIGSEVTEGDRLLEVVAQSVTVDLPSPASGLLRETLVDEDELLEVGQLLAVIESTELEGPEELPSDAR